MKNEIINEIPTYSIQTNIVNGEDFDESILDILDRISNIISKSLGRYGATTIIEDKLVGNIITKDGFTILNRIKFRYDSLASTILEIIKNVSRDLVREVGDGSTSSVVIATELYRSLLNERENNEAFSLLPNKVLLETLETLEECINEKIKERAIEITEDNFDKLQEIAEISMNNDKELGTLIANIYKEIGKEGNIIIDKSPTDNTFYNMIEGFELPRGFITSKFANQSNLKDCIIENPYILMCNEGLDEDDIPVLSDLLGHLLSVEHRGLVIIAKQFSTNIVNWMEINLMKNKKELKLLAIDYSFASTNSTETFEDLACCVGATIYKKLEMDKIKDYKEFYSLLGESESVKASELTSFIIGPKGDKEKINERIEWIKYLIDEVKKDDSIRDISKDLIQLNTRISLMLGKIAKLYVGGETDMAKETTKYLVEDTVYACKSALKHGYVSGGNLIIPKIIYELLECDENCDINLGLQERYLLKSISSSCIETYKIMMRNSNLFTDEQSLDTEVQLCIMSNKIRNLKTNELERDEDTTVINSAMTDISILRSSLSIIGLLFTSNQFISNNSYS